MWQSACTTTMHQKSSESSRNDSVTNCCQEESRNNYFLFSLPLTILLSMLFSRTANCGKNDENSEQTPQKKYPFYFSRTVKAAKRKTMTEAARAELCKRRLFPPTENIAFFESWRFLRRIGTHRRNHAFFAKTATTQRMLVEKW